MTNTDGSPYQRPLPELTPENEFFWTAGRDGVLRVQRSIPCGALLFPPTPVCPHCHSTEIDIVEVSGRGTVVGYTVNAHQWLPTMSPPYVIAMVALEEDDRVRLTTNVVGCEPDAVHIGMKVAVQFVQQDDVWFPLFAPTGDPEPGPLPAEDETIWRARPMASPDKFEDKVAISGIGMSEVGRRLMRDPLALTVEACMRAIADAGLTRDDIDGLSTYPGGGAAASGHSEGGITAVENALRVRPTWICGAPETPGQSGSIVNAMLAVASGLCRHVLCFRTVWESTHAELQRQGRAQGRGEPHRWRHAMADPLRRAVGGELDRDERVAAHAPLRHAPRDRSAGSRSNARTNAARNPAAIYREPLTMDDYLSARMITTPFGLFDCDVPMDGSVAVIVSAVDAARDLAKPPVLVEAVGTQITEPVSWDQGTLEHEPMLAGPASHLWTRTDTRPRRRRRRDAVRRLHVQLPLVDRSARVLRHGRRQGLRRRRYPHRARRRAAAQPARRPALGRAHPRVRVRARGSGAAPRRSR